MLRKRFYKLCDMSRPYPEKKCTPLRARISVEVQVGSFLYYISDEGRYGKTADFLEHLEHPFPESLEEYPVLSRHLQP